MKKILIILLTILILTGCGKKRIPWEEVESSFKEVETEVNSIAKGITEITKDDYTALLSELKSYTNDVIFDVSQDNQDLLKRMYKVSYYIEELASRAKAQYTEKLISLSKDVVTLCKITLEGEEEEFNSAKDSVLNQIQTFDSWDDDDWSKIEVLNKISWKEVGEDIIALEDVAYDEMKPSLEVTESDLEDYKNVIINNVEKFEDGINSKNLDKAKEVYCAAYTLYRYSGWVYCDEAYDVRDFAGSTMSYIKSQLGKELEEDEIYELDYSEYLNIGKKMTQSTWNTIAALLHVED